MQSHNLVCSCRVIAGSRCGILPEISAISEIEHLWAIPSIRNILEEKCMRLCSLILISFVLFATEVRGEGTLLSPAEFLGYEIGDRFTPHHHIHAYFQHVATHSPHATLREYGQSYEQRPLFAIFVSSADHVTQLETVRLNNRRLTGLEPGEIDGPAAAVVWLSYGIHGNESSSPEAAMVTLYELVSRAALGEPLPGASEPANDWLDSLVVVIDPVLNPDGRERYVSWFRRTAGRHADARLETREHHEPWPGGRSNHYYFDLNRDWIWQVQQESRQRAALYYSWMPQIHADFHEMFRNDYFFPPSAEPFHLAITDWQRQLQAEIGERNAERFDERFERYFTGEIFDLFYPGFGDTWPMFNGAVGITYEQAGHRRAGLTMIDEQGDTLTLAMRVENQHTAAVATIEVAARHSERMRQEFARYFSGAGVAGTQSSGGAARRTGARESAESVGRSKYRSFVLGAENADGRMKALLDFLDRQEIRYYVVAEGQRFTGLEYLTGQEQTRRTQAGEVVVPLDQPKSVLTRILFEPDPELVDSLTYDITAWALPYAYGLQAWATSSELRMLDEPVRIPAAYRRLPDETAYGWVFRWNDLADAVFLAALAREEVRVSVAERGFSIDSEEFLPGTVVILQRSNRHLGNRLAEILDRVARAHDKRVYPVYSGRTETGPDLGSPFVHPLGEVTVAVLADEQVSSGNLGEVWHYFDYVLEYPLALAGKSELLGALNDYSVLVLPQGRYNAWSEDDWQRLMTWVRQGGRIIAMPDAMRAMASQELIAVSLRSFESDNDSEERAPRIYGERQRQALSRRITGSVFQTVLDQTHPLAFGMGPVYATLRTTNVAPELLTSGWNVAHIPQDDAVLAGWAGNEAIALSEGSLVAGTLAMGAGQVVFFSDNPLFRGFWRNGQFLFANALFPAAVAR